MKSITLLLLAISLISADPECKDELKSFPGVIRSGSYVDDLGCYYETLTIDGKDYTYTEGKKILVKRMFLKKGYNQYVSFVQQVFYHNDNMMDQANDDFNKSKYTFSIPKVTQEGANYVVKGWVSRDGNMDPRTTYMLQTIIFSPDGNVVKGKVIESFKYNLIKHEIEY